MCIASVARNHAADQPQDEILSGHVVHSPDKDQACISMSTQVRIPMLSDNCTWE
jgi:hypothetical protein